MGGGDHCHLLPFSLLELGSPTVETKATASSQPMFMEHPATEVIGAKAKATASPTKSPAKSASPGAKASSPGPGVKGKAKPKPKPKAKQQEQKEAAKITRARNAEQEKKMARFRYHLKQEPAEVKKQYREMNKKDGKQFRKQWKKTGSFDFINKVKASLHTCSVGNVCVLYHITHAYMMCRGNGSLDGLVLDVRSCRSYTHASCGGDHQRDEEERAQAVAVAERGLKGGFFKTSMSRHTNTPPAHPNKKRICPPLQSMPLHGRQCRSLHHSSRRVNERDMQ